jgi:hypothetical protein
MGDPSTIREVPSNGGQIGVWVPLLRRRANWLTLWARFATVLQGCIFRRWSVRYHDSNTSIPDDDQNRPVRLGVTAMYTTQTYH